MIGDLVGLLKAVWLTIVTAVQFLGQIWAVFDVWIAGLFLVVLLLGKLGVR